MAQSEKTAEEIAEEKAERMQRRIDEINARAKEYYTIETAIKAVPKKIVFNKGISSVTEEGKKAIAEARPKGEVMVHLLGVPIYKDGISLFETFVENLYPAFRGIQPEITNFLKGDSHDISANYKAKMLSARASNDVSKLMGAEDSRKLFAGGAEKDEVGEKQMQHIRNLIKVSKKIPDEVIKFASDYLAVACKESQEELHKLIAETLKVKLDPNHTFNIPKVALSNYPGEDDGIIRDNQVWVESLVGLFNDIAEHSLCVLE